MRRTEIPQLDQTREALRLAVRDATQAWEQADRDGDADDVAAATAALAKAQIARDAYDL